MSKQSKQAKQAKKKVARAKIDRAIRERERLLGYELTLAERRAFAGGKAKKLTKSERDGIDWQRVAKEENVYLRSARGLSFSPKILRGSKCS